MTRRARITVVQFGNDADDPHENLAAMKEAVRRHRSSDLVVFPELALHGHEITLDHENQIRAALKAIPPAEVQAFHRFVGEEGAQVVFGELVERDGNLHNLATFTNGKHQVSYAKTHVHWSEAFTPGESFPVADSTIGPLGMLICFDAAFPEVPRILALKGARVIVNISAIPERFDLKHVHRRLVACSVQNQVVTVFANRTGDGFLGGSAVVDPFGDFVGVADHGQEHLTVEVDLSLVDAWRQEEPLFPNRRPQLYGAIAGG